MITLDTYHRYAAFFDAARKLPAWQYIRLNGDEPGEAFRLWAATNNLEVVELENTRVDNGRRIAWWTLEVLDLNVGVHLDDRCLDVEPTPPEPEPTPAEQPIRPEIAF